LLGKRLMQEKLRNGASFDNRLDHLKESVRHLVGNGSDHVKDVATSGGRLIRQHPIATIAIAAGIGLGIGMFLFMRRR